ncbi:MAG: hypothetical protein KKC84_00280 [Candidatus Omnitrophica bacterium]|nr:hypothetical protein [Candidatus Omnitrophota bacterium]
MHFNSQRSQKFTSVFLGIAAALIAVELCVRLAGGIFLSLQEYSNRSAIRQKGTYRIMCLGESMTAIGGKEAYPAQLERILNARYPSVKFTVINKGLVGADSNTILDHVEEYLNRYTPDLVTVMMGVNEWGVKYYEPIAERSSFIFNTFRSYRLLRLIGERIMRTLFPTEKVDSFAAPVRQTAAFFILPRECFAQGTSDGAQAQLALGRRYVKEQRYFEALPIFEKAAALAPRDGLPLVELGKLLFYNLGQQERGQEVLRNAIRLHCDFLDDYLHLGQFYQNQNELKKAERIFVECTQLCPGVNSYFKLQQFYQSAYMPVKAEDTIKKTIELFPDNATAFIELSILYTQNYIFSNIPFETIERLLQRAIELDPVSPRPYIQLTWFYVKQEKPAQAVEILKKGILVLPESVDLHGALAILYEKLGDFVSADALRKKAALLQHKVYPIKAIRNFRRLKKILDTRQIPLVCVQYPLRSTDLLKEIFAQDNTVILVDNQKLFQKAVRKDGYEAYFIDMFAGDFGHCNEKGNRLLAEHTAQVLLKKIFGQ